MSTTFLAGTNRSAGLAASLRRLLPDLIFGVLVIYNTIRLFRHAMWRDELQAFTLAAAANTPLDLFAKLGYEGHPGLWYLLLWVITRFTGDPFFMQVAHLLIALGVWVLIWRLSPFRPIEKLLLLLGFCLFWEYFIISRGYALMALLGFGFIALRTARPTDRSGRLSCSAFSPIRSSSAPSGRLVLARSSYGRSGGSGDRCSRASASSPRCSRSRLPPWCPPRTTLWCGQRQT